MLYKNKNYHLTLTEKTLSEIGFAVMSIAAIISLFEMHENRAQKLAPHVHASVITATRDIENRVEDLIRREKEETAHSIVSYGETMRSHPVSGKA